MPNWLCIIVFSLNVNLVLILFLVLSKSEQYIL